MMKDVSILKTAARLSVRPTVFWVTANVMGNNIVVRRNNPFELALGMWGTVVTAALVSHAAQNYVDDLLDEED